MGWLQQNSPFLVVFAAGIGMLFYNFGLDGVYRACLVAVGLGLVIFVHELGHFLTAKWCNVHVQTFSLGFGPALPGCSYKYGETTYKIGILPLGGYVQMVGEGADADEDENYPRSYKNKTVLQRMLIISAGVVMNVLLGCVCFIVVYRFHGMPMPPAVVWRVDAGSPAWKAGIPTGALFTEIGKTKKPNFETLRENVALDSWWTGFVHTVYQTLDGQTHEVDLRPRRDANDSQPVIGVSPPSKLQVPTQKDLAEYGLAARYGSAAAAARVVDLRPGDVVVRASDPTKEGDAISDLTHDVDKGTFDAAALCERMRGLGDRDMVLNVVRKETRPMKGPPEDELKVPAKGFDFDDVIAATTDPDHPDDVFTVKELLAAKAGGEAGQARFRLLRLSGAHEAPGRQTGGDAGAAGGEGAERRHDLLARQRVGAAGFPRHARHEDEDGRGVGDPRPLAGVGQDPARRQDRGGARHRRRRVVAGPAGNPARPGSPALRPGPGRTELVAPPQVLRSRWF